MGYNGGGGCEWPAPAALAHHSYPAADISGEAVVSALPDAPGQAGAYLLPVRGDGLGGGEPAAHPREAA